MDHEFMAAISEGLAQRAVATLRFQFAYMERGSKRPDVPKLAHLAVRAAVWLHGRAGELAAEELTERCVLATDLLTYLPRAIREIL